MATDTLADDRATAVGRRPAVATGGHRTSVVLWVLVGIGMALRVRQYAFRRSLWNDEAALALNVLHRGYGGLTKPLWFVQGAPIGFLWLQKTATLTFGDNEYALRLVPLVAGLLSVVVFRSLAARVLPPWGAGVAMGVFALSPTLVYYASEAKQYGVDVLAVTVLAWFLPWLLGGPVTWRRALLFGGAAAVLVWCSYPAVIVAASVSGVLALVLVVARRYREFARLAAGSALWAASFVLEYVAFLRRLHGTPSLLAYWAAGFAPRPLSVSSTVRWLGRTAVATAHFPWRLTAIPLALALLLVGEVALVRRRPAMGLLVVGILGAMVLAGMARDYPISDRMVLFTLPIVSLLFGALFLLGRRLVTRLALLAAVLVAVAPAIGTSADAVIHPYTKTEVRAAYLYVLAHRRPGDAVLVEWEGGPDYLYYHQVLGVTAIGSFDLTGSTTRCDNAAALAPLRTYRRVWFVFAIDPGRESHAPIDQYRSALRALGPALVTYRSPGNAGALLIAPTPTAARGTTVSAPTWQPARYGCLTVTLVAPRLPG